jgi:preprotein translocase subunit Sec63
VLQLKQQGRPRDYYRILGTSQSTSESELRLSYRLLALRHHPDMGGRAVLSNLVNEAYVVLGNRQRRQQCEYSCSVLCLAVERTSAAAAALPSALLISQQQRRIAL